MRRDQLEHAIRTACQIIQHPAVIVVGSQAILGSYREEELPPEATMSIEVDILPLVPSPEASGLIESTNTKIRLITRIAFGFKSPDALIALALLSLGGHRPALPGRN